MKIAIDAMGGDNAPEAVVDGTLLAQSHCSADLVLIGNEPVISGLIARGGAGPPPEVVHAAQAIEMEESGPVAIRKKRDASINIAMRMLAEGEVDAVVSAGNTSAIVASAKHHVELLPGLRRPALVVPLPTGGTPPVLLDAGAHAQAETVHLAQSAALAHIYLRVTRGTARPRIGLLNIGSEPGKGTKAVQRAFVLIKRSGLNFVGNIEPNEIFQDVIDGVVCEGFVGNIILKMSEGLAAAFVRAIGEEVGRNKTGCAGELDRVYDNFKKAFHYKHVGGAPLVGVKKTVIVAHGRSGATAISNAILLAERTVSDEVFRKMGEELEHDSSLADFRYFYASHILENLRKKWGFAPK
ncbi:MAG: phosphate acyltransferase PlsX [Desulfobacteraceae bacterium]|nr:phosphate acyltransferase PlsX [Desulfobacteraceae bacterium]